MDLTVRLSEQTSHGSRQIPKEEKTTGQPTVLHTSHTSRSTRTGRILSFEACINRFIFDFTKRNAGEIIRMFKEM
ncbi:MAG: hypothetical protein LBD27_01435 [Tannerella sp.]|nr:hypothetical protein [Tannerella sp.]